MMFLYHLLTWIVSDNKSTIIFATIYVMCPICLAAFEKFYYYEFGVGFFNVSCAWGSLNFLTLWVNNCHEVWKILPLLIQIFFLPISHLSFLESSSSYIKLLKVVPQLSYSFYHFKFIFLYFMLDNLYRDFFILTNLFFFHV